MADYKIKNTLLPIEHFEVILSETLDMYTKGEKMGDSPLVQWGQRALKAGRWWYGCEKVPENARNAAILKRQKAVIALYGNIKRNGYNGSEISVYFTSDGRVHTYDGHHRLAIMKYLGMVTNVNVVISQRDNDPHKRGDYPLERVIMKLNSGKNLYQPCADKRVADFGVWRKDSPQRLAFILQRLVGKTVLDIGCAEGYFTHAIAKVGGYKVTAIDTSPHRIAVTRYLSIISNLDNIHFQTVSWEKYLAIPKIVFDNIVFISVFHHAILKVGTEEAFKLLRIFRGKAEKVFFEAPVASGEIKWADEKQKKTYTFTKHQFKIRIEKEMDMNVTEIYHGKRPIFVLTKK